MLQWSTVEGEPQRILDFDVETVAAGFADPDWVPQKITCVAWSWFGSDEVESRICGPLGFFGMPELRAEMLRPLLAEIARADLVTGHNIGRFDLPVINAECMRLGLEPIRSVKIHDTIKLVRGKGFKKGQDVLARLYRVNGEKLQLDWQAWQEAYDEIDVDALIDPESSLAMWPTIRDRCVSDVAMHKDLYAELLARDLLKPRRVWSG